MDAALDYIEDTEDTSNMDDTIEEAEEVNAIVSYGENTENTENTKPVATMKERLAECTKCLDASFAPQNMLFDGENSTSNFAATRERILSFLQNCSSNLNDGTRPRYASVLYICGRPGTGKVRL